MSGRADGQQPTEMQGRDVAGLGKMSSMGTNQDTSGGRRCVFGKNVAFGPVTPVRARARDDSR